MVGFLTLDEIVRHDRIAPPMPVACLALRTPRLTVDGVKTIKDVIAKGLYAADRGAGSGDTGLSKRK